MFILIGIEGERKSPKVKKREVRELCSTEIIMVKKIKSHGNVSDRIDIKKRCECR